MGIKIKLNKNSHNTKSKIRNSYRLYNPKLITEYQSPLPELRIKPKIGRNGRRKPDCTVHAVCHASSAATAVVAAPAAAASGGCCWWCWWRDGEAEVVAWAVLAWWRWLVRTDRDKDKKRKKKKKNERGSYWNKIKWGGKLPNKSSKFHLLFKQYQVWSFDQLYLI